MMVGRFACACVSIYMGFRRIRSVFGWSDAIRLSIDIINFLPGDVGTRLFTGLSIDKYTRAYLEWARRVIALIANVETRT